MWISRRVSFKGIVLFLFLLSCSLLFVLFAKELALGIQKGLSLCGELVIPALFVFLCFSEWVCLSGTLQMCAIVFRPLFRLLFSKNFFGGVPLILCLVGGYPMGASALAAMGKNNCFPENYIKGLALWIFCPSPAFVINGVGQGMLHSSRAGVVLWCGCVLTCIITGFVISRISAFHRDAPNSYAYANSYLSNAFSIAIGSATEKMLVICGTVILVSGIISMVSFLPLPSLLKSTFRLFLEVTNGCSYLIEKGCSLAQLGAVLMFGGIGTHLQCRMLLGKYAPSYKVYLLVRVSQMFICYGIIWLFCLCFPDAVQTLSVGKLPTVGVVSVLPSVCLLATCCIFLCSMNQNPLYRRTYGEKPRIYS